MFTLIFLSYITIKPKFKVLSNAKMKLRQWQNIQKIQLESCITPVLFTLDCSNLLP